MSPTTISTSSDKLSHYTAFTHYILYLYHPSYVGSLWLQWSWELLKSTMQSKVSRQLCHFKPPKLPPIKKNWVSPIKHREADTLLVSGKKWQRDENIVVMWVITEYWTLSFSENIQRIDLSREKRQTRSSEDIFTDLSLYLAMVDRLGEIQPHMKRWLW